jgi:hypothetical protein
MTVTVEIVNHGTLNLLKDLESMGLIHVQSAVPQSAEKAVQGDKCSFHQLRGIHEGIPGGSVEDFLARSREDKEHELAIEKRQEEERARHRANATLSS